MSRFQPEKGWAVLYSVRAFDSGLLPHPDSLATAGSKYAPPPMKKS